MSYPLGMVLVFGAGIALVLALAWIAARARHRRAVLGSPVLIGRAMERYGITPADAEAAGYADADLLSAAQRCAECPSAGPCRAWLLARQGGPFPSHCPNLGLFQSIQRDVKPTKR